MREILFHGKRKNDGEWVLGFYERTWLTNGEVITEIRDVEEPFRMQVFHEVIPETVGQYTGLTDKNGKRIFEGDICRNTKTGEVVSVKWHGTFAGFVWSRRNDNGNLCDFGELFRAHDKYEVIGNIHDNPELMRGGEQNAAD